MLFVSFFGLAQVTPKSEIRTLLNKAQEFHKTNQDSALHYAEIAYAKSIVLNDVTLIARSIVYKNTYLLVQKKYDEAEQLFQYNFNHLDSLPEGLKGDTYYNFGSIKYLKENYDLALEHYFNAIIHYKKGAVDKGLRKAYLQIGVIYSKLNRDDLADYFYNKSLASGADNHSAKGENILPTTHDEQEKLIMSEKLLSGIKDKSNSRLAAIIYYNMAQSYIELQDYENIIKYNLESVKIKDRINYMANKDKSYAYVGEAYFNLKNYNLAIEYLNKALKNSEKRQFKLKINDLLYRAYEHIGDYKNALRVSTTINTVRDSLNLLEERERIAEITSKFETEKQAKEILLLKQENQAKELLISTNEKNIWKWTLLALLATLIAVFLGQKLMGSIKRLKTVEYEKEQIAKKVEEIAVILNNKSKIYLDKLKYIKSDGNYLEFVTDDKTIIDRNKLKDILNALPPNFVRVHRSYVINKNFIDALNSKSLFLKSNIEIPLSRTYKANIA
ncbi:LytTR family transcriptional regulator DNA-binding domain-containing protein [uncultured Psychroserpens sp.]|uniref:LytTR family transcriptional regulator DNA-binding domain-containing protein n=1 Tax=uncultured Psychroserpens sp. TaxID=255436 RepID=UPI002628B92C|nr:LytTR family transcriptional regulator DNA-binding domain-containing protein [uncultured Psychroserpens sp.]